MLASEAVPFVKVGGLADVAGALPKALMDLSAAHTSPLCLDMRLCIPFYPQIKTGKYKKLIEFHVRKGKKLQKVTCYQTQIGKVVVYLLKALPITRSEHVYSGDPGLDGDKFTLFSLAALELVKRIDWRPDIFHANDWHTAIAVYRLRDLQKTDPFFSHCRSVITLHNLPFMGAGTEKVLQDYGIVPSGDRHLPEWARNIPLPMGLSAADKVVAVSKTYARELKTKTHSCGLQAFFVSIKTKLTGIINGIDTDLWDPGMDHFISTSYDYHTLSSKQKDKAALLEELALDPNPEIPLLVFIGRMDRQKGVDLIISSLLAISRQKWNTVILGTGDPLLESSCKKLQDEYPSKVRVMNIFNSPLAHKLYAAGDILLMPSRYEPCGLSQMIAMRYGCIPVAADTGGLHDTIKPINASGYGTGFLFSPVTAACLSNTIRSALRKFADRPWWESTQVKAMCADFGWNRSAAAYFSLYRSLIKGRGISKDD